MGALMVFGIYAWVEGNTQETEATKTRSQISSFY